MYGLNICPLNEHAEYMIYPRIIALAEVGWTPMENKHPESFKRRINNENTIHPDERVQPVHLVGTSADQPDR